MNKVLRYLLTLTPTQVLVRAWALLLVGILASAIHPLSGAGAVLCTVVLVGYSYAVVLGANFTDRSCKHIARALWLVVLAVVFGWLAAPIVGISWPQTGHAGTAVSLAMSVAIFAPFFIATHAIGEARRAKGVYKTFDFVPTFVALYCGFLGGFIYIHRLVRESFPESGSNRPAG